MLDNNTLFKLPYGLYLLTAHAIKDNACIINTVMQVTADPVTICTAVNKSNLTHDIINETGIFNVNILDQSAPFSVFSHFGYQSGREVDKFKDWPDFSRSENGLIYLNHYTNAYLSVKVRQCVGLETHTLFLGEVTEAKILSEKQTVTYQDYQDHIKPQPDSEKNTKKGYICEVCGYIYEGDELPNDFICPVCKHGAEAFRPLS
ncbi:MAG: flavin reductase [Clostridiaceae bacterium]|nr:flavin reductase [Clostridiaceae bacterium]